jgi:hypothetical protein
LDAEFKGKEANVRFHTPRSIMLDETLLGIPCVCWIAMGEELVLDELDVGGVFTTLTWKEICGKCELAVVVMKHGAVAVAEKLFKSKCASRVVWAAADYSARQNQGILTQIPSLVHAAMSGAELESEQGMRDCCKGLLTLAERRGVAADLHVHSGCEKMQILSPGRRSLDWVGISLDHVTTDPVAITSATVGVSGQTTIDTNHWPEAHHFRLQLNDYRNKLAVFALSGGTSTERRAVVWSIVEAFGSVTDRFDRIVFRDGTPDVRTGLLPSLNLPCASHGSHDVLLWIDSRSTLSVDDIVALLKDDQGGDYTAMPWTIILTSDEVFARSEMDVTDIRLPSAAGTTMNECSEDMITIVPVKDAGCISDVITGDKLLQILMDVLQEDKDRGNFLEQVIVGDNKSLILRGMAPDTSFLFKLRDDLVNGTLERRLNTALAKTVDGKIIGDRKWSFDKASFASIYLRMLGQMDQLTPDQQTKLQECTGSNRSHVAGPAGCGKTFIALHMVVNLLDELASRIKLETILFVGKNEALCVYFVHWIVQRLRKTMDFKAAEELVSKHIRVLHAVNVVHEAADDPAFPASFANESAPVFDAVDGTLGFKETGLSGSPERVGNALIVVDEAHHVFGSSTNAIDRDRVTKLCKQSRRSLLLSDISQSGTSAAAMFPPAHKLVMLTEVVRISQAAELTDIKCQHRVRGPPLVPILFDSCGKDDAKRFTEYTRGIVKGLNHIYSEFVGAELHDQLVILVPTVHFRDQLRKHLEAEIWGKFPDKQFEFVTAVAGAFLKKKANSTRVVLDTLESFDGMERLFVMAVGLDSIRTTAGCCGIYRAITRAHMFVCVVQEHLKGGWLEFTANVKLDKGDFDADAERARVKRDNLSRIKGGTHWTDRGFGRDEDEEDEVSEDEVGEYEVGLDVGDDNGDV